MRAAPWSDIIAPAVRVRNTNTIFVVRLVTGPALTLMPSPCLRPPPMTDFLSAVCKSNIPTYYI